MAEDKSKSNDASSDIAEDEPELPKIRSCRPVLYEYRFGRKSKPFYSYQTNYPQDQELDQGHEETADSSSIPPFLGDRLLVGWADIAKALSCSLRKAKAYGKELKELGYLRKEWRGKPPREYVVIWQSDLKAFTHTRTKNPK